MFTAKNPIFVIYRFHPVMDYIYFIA